MNRISGSVALCLGFLVASAAPAVPPDAQKFLSQHCLDCHTGKSAEAGLDLAGLKSQPLAAGNLSRWVRVFDRVRLGEMPPKDAEPVPAAAKKSFTTSTRKWLVEFQHKQWREQGRVRGRRLTNLQLERTLHELLGVDIPLAELMPQESKTAGFTTVANGQTMSRFHLQEYLKAVDAALDEAFRRAFRERRTAQRNLYARRLSRRNPRRRTREPELIDGSAVTWSSRLIFYGRLPSTMARQSGWYRFKIRAKGLKVPASGGVWCTVRSGRCVSSAPLLKWIGALRATPKVGEWSFDAWLPRGHMLEIRPGDSTLKMARFRGGQVGVGEGDPQNVPGVALRSITMERIYRGPDAATIRSYLIDNLKIKDVENDGPVELVSRDARADLKRLMLRFARRAYRRPVEPADIARYVSFAQQTLDQSKSLAKALRTGYRALLCSPRFLYLHEDAGRLDDYALASRLSYFLWNCMPDAELLELAERKQLNQPAQLKAQVRRMLEHRKGRPFVRDFAAQWLDLDQIDATTPDRRLFRSFDVIVQHSMVAETERFLQDLLDKDLSVKALMQSNYTFLNERLARYYRIDGVDSDRLEKTELDPADHRGGLLTHGSVLKVTANGTNTSPVLRGVWISERLLGEHIPPPPDGVAAIEPDVRGAKTIRQLLARHKSSATCAACHRTIDPPGFALENFDPAGRWRYRYVKKKGRRIIRGQRVDPSGEIADGKAFRGLREFQNHVARRPHKLAANVAEKLITYGTGAPVTFADRSDVQAVVENARRKRFGFRTIVEEVVCSQVFRMK